MELVLHNMKAGVGNFLLGVLITIVAAWVILSVKTYCDQQKERENWRITKRSKF